MELEVHGVQAVDASRDAKLPAVHVTQAVASGGAYEPATQRASKVVLGHAYPAVHFRHDRAPFLNHPTEQREQFPATYDPGSEIALSVQARTVFCSGHQYPAGQGMHWSTKPGRPRTKPVLHMHPPLSRPESD